MIVLKAPQDQVLGALQAISGIVQRRHTLPILANVLIRSGRLGASNEDEAHLCIQPTVPLLPVLPAHDFEPARPGRKVALGRVRELRGFFGATKVNARNAP